MSDLLERFKSGNDITVDSIRVTESELIAAIRQAEIEAHNAAVDSALDVLVGSDIADATFMRIEKLKRKVGE